MARGTIAPGMSTISRDGSAANSSGLSTGRIIEPPPRRPRPPAKSVILAMIAPSADPAAVPPFDSLRAAMLRKDTQLSVDALALGKWTLQRYDTARVKGRQMITLERLQRLEIKRFIETGGTLLIDGENDAKFNDAVERQIVSLFADAKVAFEPSMPADTLIAGAKSARVARVEGRIAIIINPDTGQADALLEGLLTARTK